MKVLFQELPPESLLKSVWRKIFRTERPCEDIVLTVNTDRMVIQRGVVVDLPEVFVMLAAPWADFGTAYPCIESVIGP